MIAVDVGFGWTKCLKEGQKPFRFPTWVGYWGGDAISDIKTVLYEGREYAVGEAARYSRQRIEIVDFWDLLRWTPVVLRHIYNLLGEEKTVGGLPPRYYAMYKKDGELQRRIDQIYAKVYPQGFGILVDVEEMLNLRERESLLVLDIGFNTLDYFVVLWTGERYVRIAGNTVENLGVLQAVEQFKKLLPSSLVGHVKDWSRARLMDAFEKGMVKLEGREIDLMSQRQKATEMYLESLRARLKEEVGNALQEADRVVVAGGGANLVKGIRSDAFIPAEPEYSNVRGYLKRSRNEAENMRES